MKILLPVKFEEVVKVNQKYHSATLKILSQFSDWLCDNSTEFFPEYTDHGIDHVQSVLDTASEIITLDSYKIITPEDIYVLVSSILLHDCAMHISREGLWALLTEEVYNGYLIGFKNELEWSEKWIDFKNQVDKYQESDWISFYGEFRDVNLPEIGEKSLSDNQKVLIGEFIRQHHASISQVIASYGLPTKDGNLILLDDDLSYLNQLSGFVARSHNYSLRFSVDLLDGNGRHHRNTHPAFLMGVLRIADYMQFKNDRTPKLLFRVKAFCSPISILEWKKHLSIISTSDAHPDEELLFVEAIPDDAFTLTGIKKLIDGFQEELDNFWSVIGEVYSRFGMLRNLSICYRRIKSNIDDAVQYVENNHKQYYPDVLKIQSDNQKLFPLLVKPLYGDYPSVGYRELLQNSLDACSERYSKETGKDVSMQDVPYGVKVEINLDGNYFSIKDCGIGMSPEIVKNYFLKIGSSFRVSEYWKSSFEDKGISKVPRTGRFGIGMLAGFLIGDEIKVITRFQESPIQKGVTFSYKIDSKDIEIRYCQVDDIGTEIIIYSDNDRLNNLKKSLLYYGENKYYYNSNRFGNEHENISKWYYLNSPYVELNIFEAGKYTPININEAFSKNEIMTSWNSGVTRQGENFFWSRDYSLYGSQVFCNGIWIPSSEFPIVNIDSYIGSFSFDDFLVFIQDSNGRVPLSLTRKNMTDIQYYSDSNILELIKKEIVRGIKSTLESYEKFSQEIILEIIDSVSFRMMYSVFPAIFLVNEDKFILPSSLEKERYVLVDFLYSSQSRGVIYEQSFSELTELGYSCVIDVEKQADPVLNAILSFVFGIKHFSKYSKYSLNSKEIEASDENVILDGWMYIKKFDFNKLSNESKNQLQKIGMEVNSIDDEWMCAYSRKVGHCPSEIPNKIIKSFGEKIFMFGIYVNFSSKKSEFEKIYESLE